MEFIYGLFIGLLLGAAIVLLFSYLFGKFLTDLDTNEDEP